MNGSLEAKSVSIPVREYWLVHRAMFSLAQGRLYGSRLIFKETFNTKNHAVMTSATGLVRLGLQLIMTTAIHDLINLIAPFKRCLFSKTSAMLWHWLCDVSQWKTSVLIKALIYGHSHSIQQLRYNREKLTLATELLIVTELNSQNQYAVFLKTEIWFSDKLIAARSYF